MKAAGTLKNFDKTSSELKEILSKMLQINPYLRPTAAELLSSSIFDKIRVKHLEKPSAEAILLPMDQKDSYQYESSID